MNELSPDQLELAALSLDSIVSDSQYVDALWKGDACSLTLINYYRSKHGRRLLSSFSPEIGKYVGKFSFDYPFIDSEEVISSVLGGSDYILIPESLESYDTLCRTCPISKHKELIAQFINNTKLYKYAVVMKLYDVNNERIFLLKKFRNDEPVDDYDMLNLPYGKAKPFISYSRAMSFDLNKKNINSDAHSVSSAVDGNSNSFWEYLGKGPFIVDLFTEGKKNVIGYQLLPYADSNATCDRMPSEWKFYATRDGHIWDLIDQRSSIDFCIQPVQVQFEGFQSSQYNHFRFVFDNSSKMNLIRIGKIQLIAKEENHERRILRPWEVCAEMVPLRPWPFRFKSVEPASVINPARSMFIYDDDALFWETKATSPHDVYIYISKTTSISGYQLIPAPYGTESYERMPSEWSLLGSIDGYTWQLIDNRTDVHYSPSQKPFKFTPACSGSFSYFKFIFKVKSYDILRIGKIQFNVTDSTGVESILSSHDIVSTVY